LSCARPARAVNRPAQQTAKTVVLRAPSGYRFPVMRGSDRLELHKSAKAIGVGQHHHGCQVRDKSAAAAARADFPESPSFA
jgi:prolyl-tRNA editing enzyme YbaK/EbsC (Cys-tRNA(Pro) deacylase)